ncbi:MAG TPA: PP2C family protein-serine/threonine phosphatase [Bacteroidota bacterium]
MHKTISEEPKLRRVLSEDLRRGDFWRTMSKDVGALLEFYTSENQKTRLRTMGRLKRWFFTAWWILKSMMLHLSPGRRLLIFLGLILVYFGPQVRFGDTTIQSSDWHVLGGTMLILVLMLELKDKLLARDELEAGRKIQTALMPPASPDVPGWSVWLYSQPANEVGGDLVDFLPMDANRVGIALGDVAGKGLKAALLMAKLQATIRALATDMKSLSTLAGNINRIFHRDSIPGVFASLLYVTVEKGGKIRYVNAGHLPPMVISGKTVQEKGKGDTAVGLAGEMHFKEQSLRLNKGEVFFAYSDGLVEARNEQGEFFGIDRLRSILRGVPHRFAPEMGEALLKEVKEFRGAANPADDLSIVILRRD